MSPMSPKSAARPAGAKKRKARPALLALRELEPGELTMPGDIVRRGRVPCMLNRGGDTVGPERGVFRWPELRSPHVRPQES